MCVRVCARACVCVCVCLFMLLLALPRAALLMLCPCLRDWCRLTDIMRERRDPRRNELRSSWPGVCVCVCGVCVCVCVCVCFMLLLALPGAVLLMLCPSLRDWCRLTDIIRERRDPRRNEFRSSWPGKCVRVWTGGVGGECDGL